MNAGITEDSLLETAHRLVELRDRGCGDELLSLVDGDLRELVARAEDRRAVLMTERIAQLIQESGLDRAGVTVEYDERRKYWCLCGDGLRVNVTALWAARKALSQWPRTSAARHRFEDLKILLSA